MKFEQTHTITECLNKTLMDNNNYKNLDGIITQNRTKLQIDRTHLDARKSTGGKEKLVENRGLQSIRKWSILAAEQYYNCRRVNEYSQTIR